MSANPSPQSSDAHGIHDSDATEVHASSGPTEVPPRPSGVGAARILAVLLALALLGVGYLAYRTNNSLQNTRAELATTGDALRTSRGHETATEQRAQQLDTDLGAARARTQDLEAQVAAAESRANQSEAQLNAARASFTTERGQLTAQLNAARAHQQDAEALAARLRTLVGANRGETHADASGQVSLQLIDRVLFAPGSADLTPDGIAVLHEVADVLRSVPDKQIWVQGHTDVAAPPHPERFPTNWELSTARALAVVHYLQDQEHVDPHRLAAVGFSQYRPLSNRAGAHNRRIELVLLPQHLQMTRMPEPSEPEEHAATAPAAQPANAHAAAPATGGTHAAQPARATHGH